MSMGEKTFGEDATTLRSRYRQTGSRISDSGAVLLYLSEGDHSYGQGKRQLMSVACSIRLVSVSRLHVR
jgi:hypothetical protein